MHLSEKLADKKKQILKTALQLFSTKGISATSMQEIAEYCGMSKGSLYLHFKSKEDLESSIYLYCEGLIRDSVMQVEQEHLLTPKEQLRKQLEVVLNLLVELREFLVVQIQDHHASGKKPPSQKHLREKQIIGIQWFKNKLEQIYGDDVYPYTLDLTMFVVGLLDGYIRTLFIPGLPLNIRRVADHIVFLLDEVAGGMVRSQRDPLISPGIWTEWTEKLKDRSGGSLRHPLIITKQMRDLLKDKLPEGPERDLAQESIDIIDKEFRDIEPRKAILAGMIANLESVPELVSLSRELKEICRLYVFSRTDRT